MCSAKLERWAEGMCGECGEVILSAGGGGERPMEDVELLSDCRGDGVAGASASFFPPSAMVGASAEGGAGCGRRLAHAIVAATSLG